MFLQQIYYYLQVFFAILIASFSFGQAGPAIAGLATARGAAYFVFNLIERVSVEERVHDVRSRLGIDSMCCVQMSSKCSMYSHVFFILLFIVKFLSIDCFVKKM